MRVLITGASGMVGGGLASLLADSFQIVAARPRASVSFGADTFALDLASRAWPQAIANAHAQAVIHCAALASADDCERDPVLAEELNVNVPRHLAALCRAEGQRLIHLSTDLVFDGRQERYRETDPARPLMVYARTKLAGEQAVLDAYPEAAVVRIALVYGRGHGPRATASEAIAWSLLAGRPMRLFRDQYRTPIDLASLADGFKRLLASHQCGLFHMGGPERLSRYELGLRVARAFGLSTHLIEPIDQAQLPLGAPRPRDVSLDSSRAVNELGWRPMPLDRAIAEGRDKAL
ncbi:MAG: SDR family oxidoreductase [Vicinamibacteria bacterium]|nr:SDR family oxidoreductase [Vicinamibacteria bacterium]